MGLPRTDVKLPVIPARLKQRIADDTELAGIVDSAFKSVADLFSNHMPLFPEFTDHSFNHLERVLGLCDYLIPDETLNGPLTARDVACLCLAVLLHDSGMHFTMKQFSELLKPGWDNDRNRVSYFDKQSWATLWEEYHAEAARWNDLKRIDTLGKEDDESPRHVPDEWPPQDTEDIVPRRYVGEFIRRHHPRLAHLFALRGIPSAGSRNGKIVIVGESQFSELADLAGVVARSHGLELRSVFAYFREKYDGLLHRIRDCHPLYLMGVLRIADYLDLYAARAPKAAFQVSEPRSPFSRNEWRAHQSIEEIQDRWAGDDTVLYLVSRPKTAEHLLRVRKWIAGIRQELDEVWAVFGEEYRSASPFKLSLRRVKSNIEDDCLLRPHISFVPRPASSSVDVAIIPSLIKPLYGDRPGVGVRELMQNALDAVHERKNFCKRFQSETRRVERALPKLYRNSEVELALCRRGKHKKTICPQAGEPVPSDWRYWFRCRDSGVGMTPDTIIDFFLKAGATFRRSDEWLKLHSGADQRSIIPRSGRFGVGFFAAFLLGEQVRVVTRHITEGAPSIMFDPRTDSQNIELSYGERRTIGTTVYVRLDEDNYNGLANERFRVICLSPQNEEMLSGGVLPIYADVEDENIWAWSYDSNVARIRSPETEDCDKLVLRKLRKINKEWNELLPTPSGYERVRWRVPFEHEMGALICNGIAIGNRDDYPLFDFMHHWSYQFVDVIDHDGVLPLQIDRMGLSDEPVFMAQLRADVIHHVLAAYMLFVPSKLRDMSRRVLDMVPVVNGVRSDMSIFLEQGMGPNWGRGSDLDDRVRVVFESERYSNEGVPYSRWWRAIAKYEADIVGLTEFTSGYHLDTEADFIDRIEDADEQVVYFVPHRVSERWKEDRRGNWIARKVSAPSGYFVYSKAGRPIRTWGRVQRGLRELMKEKEIPKVIQWWPPGYAPEMRRPAELDAVMKTLELPWIIPFDLDERKRVCGKAYSLLKSHIANLRRWAARNNETVYWDE